MTRQEKIKAAEEGIKKVLSNIEDCQERNDCFFQQENQNLKKNKLELKFKDKQEQLDALTKSLTSSSRLGNWISRIRELF